MGEPVVLEVGGRQVHLVLDFNALARWESVSGRSALAAGTWEHLSAADLRALIWAMGAHGAEWPTIEEVGAALTPDRLEEVLQLVDGVLGISLPRPAGAGGENVEALQERWLELHAFGLVELGRTPAELGAWTPALLEAVKRRLAERERREDRRAALVAATVATALTGRAITADELLAGDGADAGGAGGQDIVRELRKRGLASG